MKVIWHQTKGININKSFIRVKGINKIAFLLEIEAVEMRKSNPSVNKSIEIYQLHGSYIIIFILEDWYSRNTPIAEMVDFLTD